jgi:hypothetical protein
MEGPSVHSRCLAFIPFKFWEEGPGGGEDFFSFFFGSQCVPQHVQWSSIFPVECWAKTIFLSQTGMTDRQTPWSKWGHKSTGCCCGPPAGPLGGCLPCPPCPALPCLSPQTDTTMFALIYRIAEAKRLELQLWLNEKFHMDIIFPCLGGCNPKYIKFSDRWTF